MRKWLVASIPVLAASVAVTAFLARAEPREAPAAAPLKTATSRVTHVTVYQSNALVTREVDVPEGEGTFELVVTALPAQTVNSSLYSEGTDGIRVLTTRYRTRPIKEDTREEVRKLEAEQKKLQMDAQKIQADVKALDQNIQLLSKLEGFTAASTQHATEKGNLNSDSAIALSKHIMDQRGELSRQLVDLQQKLQLNTEQTQFIQRQLSELAAGSSKVERDAVLVVDKKNAVAGKVRFNYLVDSASWRPQYKLRAGKDKEPVQLEYLAAVVQQTGEDWNGVNLVLSTAQPMLNAAPPELNMLEVALLPRGNQQPAGGPGGPGNPANPMARAEELGRAQVLRGQAQSDYNAKKAMSGGKTLNEAAAIEQTVDLLSPMEKPKGAPPTAAREGQSVTYHLNTKLTVPSRNDEQMLEVARIDMAPDYYYKAVPVLTAHVYRLANLTNKSPYVLLPGEATMYLGTDFVGQMNMPLVAIGEQFTAGFGVDPQLQVQRQQVEKTRSMTGGNQVFKYEYRILCSSYKAEPVSLQVWDRLPHAENDTVGVSLLKTEPEVSADSLYQREQRPQNLLRWDLKVDPAMNGEKAKCVKYEFKLEMDRQMMIGNFITK